MIMNQNEKSDIGLIGLAVMGENLVLNIESRGYKVSVFNRTYQKTSDFLKSRGAQKNIVGFETLQELVASLKTPRKIMMMIRAGSAVDQQIDTLMPLLDPGDILIDGGNSNFTDTQARVKRLEAAGLYFVGAGVSGGEEGALKGPSIMPGGSAAAWEFVKPIFTAIAAKTDSGEACCDWVGQGGAGHFVKMVHNGIEYGDMQLISEAYAILKAAGFNNQQLKQVFEDYNQGDLNSYLIEITRDILGTQDVDGEPLVEKILDAAAQKGTGKWTGMEALDKGVPLTLITEAVFARLVSSQKELRVQLEGLYPAKPVMKNIPDQIALKVGQALFAAKIVSYAQGFELMQKASKEYNWNIDFGAVAMMWRGGCIIRSGFLSKIRDAYAQDSALQTLIASPWFSQKITESLKPWREITALAFQHGIPVPAMSSALSWFDGMSSGRVAANMIQAQRDYFGAHQYERIDKPRGEFFHTDWTGKGGSTASSTYQV
jgi:6-phosphogluconate dehydrogenase